MAEKTITIPQADLRHILVRIVGTTPLLTNRFSEAAKAKIANDQEHGPKVARAPRDPDAEFKAAAHEITPGVFGFPGAGIKKALVAAGGRFADEQMTRLRGALNVMEDLVTIDAPAPTMRQDTIRLQGKTASIAYRPQFSPWSMFVPVRFNAGVIGEAQIFNLFQIAGFAVGIGAWRPECNGTFGQFALDHEGPGASG